MHHLLVLSTVNGKLGPWFPNTDAPTITTYTDSGLSGGQTLGYHVEVTDGRNVRKGIAAAVKVADSAGCCRCR